MTKAQKEISHYLVFEMHVIDFIVNNLSVHVSFSFFDLLIFNQYVITLISL